MPAVVDVVLVRQSDICVDVELATVISFKVDAVIPESGVGWLCTVGRNYMNIHIIVFMGPVAFDKVPAGMGLEILRSY